MDIEWTGSDRDSRDVNRLYEIFFERLEKEITRLKRVANTMEGPDQIFVTQLVYNLELEYGRYSASDNPRTKFDDDERERTLASIIDYLNKIKAQVKDLEVTIEAKQHLVSSRAEAERTVSQFFYDCQVVEEKIKHYGTLNCSTKKQVEELNTQLKSLVHRMIALSKKSELLNEAILESYVVKILS